MAQLAGPDVNAANDFGIWATDLTGTLQLIAREGDMLETITGELKTISQLRYASLSNNEDGLPSGFND